MWSLDVSHPMGLHGLLHGRFTFLPFLLVVHSNTLSVAQTTYRGMEGDNASSSTEDADERRRGLSEVLF
jgi:hypothetical protein